MRVTDGDGQRVGDGVVDRHELAVEGADALALPDRRSLTLRVVGRDDVVINKSIIQSRESTSSVAIALATKCRR